jgi:hypothetical protein
MYIALASPWAHDASKRVGSNWIWLYFIHSSSKSGVFIQKDYLTQLLQPHIQPILEVFAAVIYLLRPIVEPLFMEDGNSTHGHKSTYNYCAKWRTAHGVILIPYLSTSPDINSIEKCWRRIKQALHRRKHQPITEAQMEAAVTEE